MAADSGLLTILIVLDLSTAFDTISYSILLETLASIEITDKASDWFESYLYGSTQFIQLSNLKFSSFPVTTRALQESVVDPLLFIIYIPPLGHI